MKSQADRILDYLKTGKSITSLEAIQRFGCTRLAAQIFRLKKRGHEIASKDIYVTNRWGDTVRCSEYRLIKKETME